MIMLNTIKKIRFIAIILLMIWVIYSFAKGELYLDIKPEEIPEKNEINNSIKI